MNISEIEVGRRVVISRRPFEKEVAVVKGFTSNGLVIVRDSAGQPATIAPEYVTKMFDRK